MSQTGKLMPNLDQQSTKVLNLTVLQRIDPFVEEILITAAHVTFYEFNIDLNQWSRKDIEGSLFVVKRNTQPRFQFIVMNRKNTDNLVEDILGDFEYEVQVPYLLYRNGAQEVNGIWFYNSQDCEAVANIFSRILSAFSKVPPKPKVSSTQSCEFEELEAVPSLAVIEGPLEPTTSSAAIASDVPDESFISYFSAAMNMGNASNTVVAGQPLQSSLNTHLSSHAPSGVPSSVLSLQPVPTLPTSSTHMMPVFDTQESTSSISRYPNLIKPPLFAPPSSSSLPSAPPAQPPAMTQRPYGSPLLQPFPPPTPSSSLAPIANYGPVVTKDRIRDAFLRLVQNNQFIDLVYRELTNDHNP